MNTSCHDNGGYNSCHNNATMSYSSDGLGGVGGDGENRNDKNRGNNGRSDNWGGEDKNKRGGSGKESYSCSVLFEIKK